MPNRVCVTLGLVLASVASVAGEPGSYASAMAIWEKTKDEARYQAYAAEFAQFNNHFHLDEKDGCYALGQGQVNLVLVITHPPKNEFAVIEKVFSDVDNPKAQCFKKSYEGIKTKVPPFAPFALQMQMG
jgi:hypothetical protein